MLDDIVTALDLTSGAELVAFDLGTVQINGTAYEVLTGHEVANANGDRICFWCGGALAGKLRRYCRGHMTEYYGCFDWTTAASQAKKRADGGCENCSKTGRELPAVPWGFGGVRSPFEVHHIVPLQGERRQFTAYNLPWNLIVLCHWCHVELHAILRPPKLKPAVPTSREQQVAAGQLVMV